MAITDASELRRKCLNKHYHIWPTLQKFTNLLFVTSGKIKGLKVLKVALMERP